MVNCGNPNSNKSYEQCSYFDEEVVLLTVLPILVFIMSSVVSYMCMINIVKKPFLQHDVEWPSTYALQYMNAAKQSVLGPINIDILDSRRRGYLPLGLSHMHISLRTHFYANALNISWTLGNMLLVSIIIVGDARSGAYWRFIGIMFLAVLIVHVAMIIASQLFIVPDLFKTGLRRNIFENYGRCNIPRNNIRPFFYLDQYEVNKGPPNELVSDVRKSVFAKSYKDAIDSSELVKMSHGSILSSAGSSFVSFMLLVAGSINRLDANGTVTSINALSLTFSIAAAAQVVNANNHLVNARISSIASTVGIERINNVTNTDWADNLFIKCTCIPGIRIWKVSEKPISIENALDERYFINSYDTQQI